MENRLKVLVVGQVPPPWGGQAVMIQKLLEAKLSRVDLFFVPMSFSSEMDEIGKFKWKKITLLPILLKRIWAEKFRSNCQVLYFPPGGENLTSVYRDIVLLLGSRLLFKKVIFHVHAGGFTEVVQSAPRPIRLLAQWAYRRPELTIQLTEKSPPDAVQIESQKIATVANGLTDQVDDYSEVVRYRGAQTGPVTILFVGVVCESKGVLVLLNACADLKQRGVDCVFQIMGRFSSVEFEAQCRSIVKERGLDDLVDFVGVQTGEDKWQYFKSASLFCFPSFFAAENQSLVILEAMQFGLPSVATDWRGMSTMVSHGKNGYLVPVKNPEALADQLTILVEDPELRLEMGARARKDYLENYTDDVWRQRMEEAILDA